MCPESRKTAVPACAAAAGSLGAAGFSSCVMAGSLDLPDDFGQISCEINIDNSGRGEPCDDDDEDFSKYKSPGGAQAFVAAPLTERAQASLANVAEMELGRAYQDNALLKMRINDLQADLSGAQQALQQAPPTEASCEVKMIELLEQHSGKENTEYLQLLETDLAAALQVEPGRGGEGVKARLEVLVHNVQELNRLVRSCEVPVSDAMKASQMHGVLEIEQAHRQARVLEKQLAESEAEVCSRDWRIDELSKWVQQLTTKQAELQELLAASNEKIAELVKERDHMLGELLEDSDEYSKDLQKQLAETNQKLAQATERIAQHEAECSEQSKAVLNLVRDHDRKREHLELALSRATSEIAASTTAHEELQEQVASCKSAYAQVDELGVQLMDTTERLAGADQQLQRTEQELAVATAKLRQSEEAEGERARCSEEQLRDGAQRVKDMQMKLLEANSKRAELAELLAETNAQLMHVVEPVPSQQENQSSTQEPEPVPKSMIGGRIKQRAREQRGS